MRGRTRSSRALPIPLTRAALDAIVENVKFAQELLPVPLALESTPRSSNGLTGMNEADFVCEILDRTGAMLLPDLATV